MEQPERYDLVPTLNDLGLFIKSISGFSLLPKVNRTVSVPSILFRAIYRLH